MAFYDILVLISLILWILIASGLIITLVVVVPRLLKSFTELDRLTNVVTTQLLPVIESVEGVAECIGRRPARGDDWDVRQGAPNGRQVRGRHRCIRRRE